MSTEAVLARASSLAISWQGLKTNLGPVDLRVREAVLSMHLGIEHLLDLLILTAFLKPDDEERFQPFMLVLSKIDFAKKVTLARELNVLPGDSHKGLHAINDVRVAFAHGFRREHKRFVYKGKSIREFPRLGR
jgi:hypothetical protein